MIQWNTLIRRLLKAGILFRVFLHLFPISEAAYVENRLWSSSSPVEQLKQIERRDKLVELGRDCITYDIKNYDDRFADDILLSPSVVYFVMAHNHLSL